jgi:hypothetical protein
MVLTLIASALLTIALAAFLAKRDWWLALGAATLLIASLANVRWPGIAFPFSLIAALAFGRSAWLDLTRPDAEQSRRPVVR